MSKFTLNSSSFSVRNVWLLCLFGLIITVYAQFEGDKCILRTSRRSGICTIIHNCPEAIALLSTSRRPQTCGFKGRIPIVCCGQNSSHISIVEQQPGGIKSKKQCENYNREVSNTFSIAAVGGKKSLAKEFPHMAIVGYGDSNDIQWQCGGSLISEQFVLTAAHCMRSPEFGNARYVRLGDLDIKNTTDDAQPEEFRVKRLIPHPEYKPPLQYHDIGLLELDHAATFTDYVKPGCLNIDNGKPEYELIATGWGKTEFAGQPSSHLINVDLKYAPNNVCRRAYASTSPSKLPNGILEEIHLCAGQEGKDTCQGDSGGPLQVSLNGLGKKPWKIVGVTSFGKACGLANSPGVYTRVSAYIPWIESIVWPN